MQQAWKSSDLEVGGRGDTFIFDPSIPQEGDTGMEELANMKSSFVNTSSMMSCATNKIRSAPQPKAQSRKFFYIHNKSGGLPTLIQVKREESSRLTVSWLLNAYIKQHLTDPDFDMGSIACLKCRVHHLNYDYLLSRMEVPLDLFPDRMDLEPYFVELCHGVNISSFHILDIIGFGAFGQVVVVRKKDTGGVYAMKILKKDKFLQINKEEYIFEEKKILTLLENQFVSKIFYAFQSNHYVFFVMDFYPGGDLFHFMQGNRKVSEEVARFYIAEIICALDYLHEQGIIYRDLKPENVMLDWRGHVKIVDFGLSKKLSKKTMMTHSFVGTDGYVSPEIMDRKGHNFTTDLYNLGVMLYDFLHARPPYSKFDPASGTYVPSRNSQLTFSNEISEDAKSLLRLLLDKNPNMRLGGEQQTRCLLYHPWFKSVRAALEAGDELKVPTSKDLSLNIFQSEDFIDEIDDLVDNLERDYEETRYKKQNTFSGFDYDCLREGNSSSGGTTRPSIHHNQVKRSDIPTGDDVPNEDVSNHPIPVINILRNKTKLTRDNIINGTCDIPNFKRFRTNH